MGLLLILLSNFLYVYAEEFSPYNFFKAGISANSTYISKVNLDDEIPYGAGMQTHVGRRFHPDWDLSLSSYLVFTYLDDITFRTPRGRIVGDIEYLNLSFVLLLKRFIGEQSFTGWENYIAAGPARSVQNIWFDYATVEEGEFNHEHKMTMEGIGFVVSTGVERMVGEEKTPIFFEFTYLFNRSEKVSEVGGTSTEIEIVSSDKTNENYDHTFMFSAGMRIF